MLRGIHVTTTQTHTQTYTDTDRQTVTHTRARTSACKYVNEDNRNAPTAVHALNVQAEPRMHPPNIRLKILTKTSNTKFFLFFYCVNF